MSTTMNRIPSQSQHGNRRWVGVPHDVHTRKLRQRAGNAYRDMGATISEIQDALGHKSHSGASRRTRGEDGPFAAYLEEVRAFVLKGHRIDTHIAAIVATAAEAERDRGEAFDPKSFALESQKLDVADDLARSAFLAGKLPARQWADKIEQYVAFVLQRLPHLRKEAVS